MLDEVTAVKSQLDPNAILVAEFQYIAQAAFQANEDRARVSNYFLVVAGATAATIFRIRLEETPVWVYWIFAGVFGILSMVGLLTLLQLARLRAAWTETVQAMNQIKDYYRRHCPEAQLDQAFAWTTASIPPVNKRMSMAFLLAASVVLVDAVTAAATVLSLSLALGSPLGNPVWVAAAVLAGLAFAVLQDRVYFGTLSTT